LEDGLNNSILDVQMVGSQFGFRKSVWIYEVGFWKMILAIRFWVFEC